ncbi:RNA-directed DNA polymerase [Bacteroides sp. 519]|uniref:RNA-directed DNA polymerase n=1 Tax=Bacteroides sp. 519 TaxID=2302937 RepID=UPI0013CFB1DB|nr:reverse transcriptase domain-containing protein [Bacteroides sp. 519]
MIGFEKLMEAYLECRSNKRYTSAALAFEVDVEENLLELWREINNGRYKISPAIAFVVDNPVKREVFAANFRDRIVHYFLMHRLKPHFEKEFIFDSYACRPNKGTLFGINRIKKFIARCSNSYTKDCYILKCDISGFFMNIDRDILWRMLKDFIEKHEVEDKKMVLQLTEQVVLHDPTTDCYINGGVKQWQGVPKNKSLFGTNGKPMPGTRDKQLKLNFTESKGLPIGNLTSQWFGNFYLNALDHYVKNALGICYYGRYVDDFIVIHEDKEYLKSLVDKVEKFLKNKLELELHPKKRYMQHYSKGVTFLGAKIRNGALLTGKRTKGRLYDCIIDWNKLSHCRLLTVDELARFRNSINSYWGIIQHYNSYGLRRRTAGRFSGQITNRVSYPGFKKVCLNDYIIVGKEVVPYFEFNKLKTNKL